jgi:phosphopantothenoylcysteine decarboxylase
MSELSSVADASARSLSAAHTVPTALRGRTIVVGVTGSVAAIRVPALVDGLRARGATIVLVATANGLRFLGQAVLRADWTVQSPATEELVGFFQDRGVRLYTDKDEWQNWRQLGDPVLHIEIRRQADALLIAPASADMLAKLANGYCDNLLLCVARAWELGEKPFLLAPAMNTAMWRHPITAQHLQTLTNWGIHVIEPVVKLLACGDTGMGAMAAVDAVIEKLETQFTGNISPGAPS